MNKIENILSSKDNRIFLHRASNAASAAIAAQALNMGRSVVLVATSKEMLHNLNALTRLFIPEASMAGPFGKEKLSHYPDATRLNPKIHGRVSFPAFMDYHWAKLFVLFVIFSHYYTSICPWAILPVILLKL